MSNNNVDDMHEQKLAMQTLLSSMKPEDWLKMWQYLYRKTIISNKEILNVTPLRTNNPVQDSLFVLLHQLYNTWKTNPELIAMIPLPDLNVFPKALPKPRPDDHNFLVRPAIFDIFCKLQGMDSKESKSVSYGLYLAGPFGVGKSVALYTIACLALSMDWLVIYVPACDAWVAQLPETQPRYFLRHLARGLYHLLDTATYGGRTLREIFESAVDLPSSEIAVAAVAEFLSNYDERPVLLIFDEVNAIYSQGFQNKSFFAWAQFTTLELKRGWKLISATGHAAFIQDVPNGLERYVLYLQPWEDREFDYLLQSDITCDPMLLELVQKNANWKLRVRTITGKVPRELTNLNAMIDQNRQTYQAITNFLKRFEQIVTDYEYKSVDVFSRTNAIYTDNLQKQSSKKLQQHVESVIQALIGVENVMVSLTFVDQALMYFNAQEKRLLPLTPLAGTALIHNLRTYFSLANDSDATLVLDLQISDQEKTKAFERLMIKQLLFSNSRTLSHTSLSKTKPDRKIMAIKCEQIIIIPTNEVLPKFSTNHPVLLVPANKLYPIADLLLVDQLAKKVLLIQITISGVNCKLPNTGSYPAIWDPTHWKDLVKNSYPRHCYAANYATELLQLLDIDNTIELDPTTKYLVERDKDGNVFPCTHFEYLIMSPKTLGDNAWACYDEFPWVRVAAAESLTTFLSDKIVAALTAV